MPTPHTTFPWDIFSLETPAHPGTFTQLLLLLAMPKTHSGTWSSCPSLQEVFLSQPGPFPVPAPHPSRVPQGPPAPHKAGDSWQEPPWALVSCVPALIPAPVSPGDPGAKAIESLHELPHMWHMGSMGQEPGLGLGRAP